MKQPWRAPEPSREGQGVVLLCLAVQVAFLFIGLLFRGYFVILQFIFWQELILCVKLKEVQRVGLAWGAAAV